MTNSPVVFVSGSRSIKTLPAPARKALDTIVSKGFSIVVGDAWGVDSLVQRYLRRKGYRNVSVYHIGKNARACHGFPCQKVMGSRQTDKDAAMADCADYGLAIWDGVSPGTRQNILRLRGKTRVIQTR